MASERERDYEEMRHHAEQEERALERFKSGPEGSEEREPK
jgi:hypothetical protein